MSNLMTKTEKSPAVMVVWAIILLISSFFMPFIIVFLIHNSFFQNREQWLFVAPGQGYITFMAGMVWIALVMFMHLFIQYRYELKFMKWITLVLLLFSIPVFMVGATNYYYFDDKGLHYNELKSFNHTDTYEWNSFKEVKQVHAVRTGDNAKYLESYEFITTSNKHFVVPYEDFRGIESRVLEKLEKNQVKVTDNYYE
ncbi:hypothetical protein [Bacillus sp. FJAT-27445]|uniref:hypothetical protein n=1 Tax=Bacillus sp. FJAT-27445 TaxID=1679166 RepID=UPI0007433CF9|nr:hypothetical protein [Bacillus sp. FJAT-27445]